MHQWGLFLCFGHCAHANWSCSCAWPVAWALRQCAWDWFQIYIQSCLNNAFMHSQWQHKYYMWCKSVCVSTFCSMSHEHFGPAHEALPWAPPLVSKVVPATYINVNSPGRQSHEQVWASVSTWAWSMTLPTPLSSVRYAMPLNEQTIIGSRDCKSSVDGRWQYGSVTTIGFIAMQITTSCLRCVLSFGQRTFLEWVVAASPLHYENMVIFLCADTGDSSIILYIQSLIHIWRCRRSYACRSRWSPYH